MLVVHLVVDHNYLDQGLGYHKHNPFVLVDQQLPAVDIGRVALDCQSVDHTFAVGQLVGLVVVDSQPEQSFDAVGHLDKHWMMVDQLM